MLKWLKISHHNHSGLLRPHEHTSYFLLGVVLVIAIFPLTAFTVYADSPGPQSESIGLTGVMPGIPPTIAATIDIPNDQQHFSTSPITVSGTCPKDTLVEVYKTDIFAGSTTCKSDETYSLEIDLLIGKNILVAKVYDALNQPGPDSNIVNIYYDALPAQSDPLQSFSFEGAQLVINSDSVYRGIFPDKSLSIPISILGGIPPFAVNVEWGDSTNSVVSRNNNDSFTANHIYTKAGTYQITIQVSDAQNRIAFLTVAAIVNGQPSLITTSTSTTTTKTNTLLVIWPLYAILVAIVTSFWAGEKREKHILEKRGLLLTQ